ncbi:phenylalanine 4-monooxygenase [Flexithrix dorotheae]|uniref:phenylalanine 4-monooxygenase n=1 Tax=Flexithrix dorotheae TaxID=70993 RepID=UPI000380F862|nr:phenylalanine 4-monooxygenase [Flexithrix dorotheae]
MLQNYSAYTAEDKQVWELLYNRQMEILPGRASTAFLEGIKKIGFVPQRIPNFEEVNQTLLGITGWQLEVVKGLIPNKEFFELLENKRFPATTWFRKLSQIDYLEEPDMFHDVFGHVPLLTDENFCGFLKGLSKIALKHINNEWAIEMIARLYWYTVEFGLIRNKEEGLRIYGAGILSSPGESIYALENKPIRTPYNIKEIITTPYIKDRFQEKYWVIKSYKQLYESVGDVALAIENELSPSALH